MPLVLTEEELMLKNSAREFLKDRSPVSELRLLRDTQSSLGYDPNLWKEMAEMGWTSLTISEEFGGLDFGYSGLGQILEETGRTLTASPMVATVLLGSTLLSMTGNQEQKEAYLPAIVNGACKLAFAMDESNRHNPFHVATTAERANGGYIINGKKVFVLDGHIADRFIVLARTSGITNDKEGLSLFLVDPQLSGIECQRTIMMDSRNAAKITFNNVKVPSNALLGEENKAGDVLEQVLNIACIGLSAEMLGTMLEAFDRTVNYLKERLQFGVPIGSFQALQHRAAQMYSEIELCKTLVLQSLQAIDKGAPNLSELASMTKAKVSETLQLVTNEGIQMFGGIGMTDDEEIGFFLKRARVAQQTFGDAAYHLDRFARLSGF